MSTGNSRHSLFLADCEGCPHTVILAVRAGAMMAGDAG